MASLLLPPSTSSSAASSLFSRSAFPNPTFSAARVFSPNAVRCELTEPLNGKSPCVPVLNDQILPKYLQSKRLENAVNKNSNNRIKIFSGSANYALSQEIAWYMGLNLGDILIKRFADGEIYVQLQESVRGCDVYLVQPTCPPANENLMELLIMIDACRRASAKNITAVIPYFGYARSDRKTHGRESIAAKLVANLITESGADRVLACDIHSGQSMGYFDIPVDHVYCQPVILDYLASKKISSGDLVVVSPDVGGVARARAFAKKLSDAPLAIVDKRRQGHNVAEGSDEMHARNGLPLDSHSCKASTSDFHPSDIYTPRSVLRPTSPVRIGSPLLRPRLPQQTSPPFRSSTPIAAIQHTYPKQSTLHQHTFGDFSKQSPNSNTPSYWDPNILRVMFR